MTRRIVVLACVLLGSWTGSALAAASGPRDPAASGAAQERAAGARRHATTVGALVAYPVFFHTQPVRVRGTFRAEHDDQVLVGGDASVLVVGREATGAPADTSSVFEVTGVFLDVGRLTEGDPRLTGIDVNRLSQERLQKPWPGVGELLLLHADSVNRAEPFHAPTIRSLALAPERYVDSRVTVVGRFRGRNLYGDQPDAPGRSRWDFVLQSADASIWIVGLRPQGQGFNLKVDARVDTGRWLEVSGLVHRERHLVLLEGTSVTLAQPAVEAPPSEPVVRVPAVGPRPEVVFSAPTPDETDVSLATTVRIQFSRDLDPGSIQGQVRVSYSAAQSAERGEAQPPPVPFTTRYDEGTRVLEIRFGEPLERFRVVRVDLLDGIKATDGAPLVAWTLTFTLGG
jgi:hypothetical protein